MGGSLVLPQDDRMALGPETMGPGRGQVLDPGQEKDDLKINTDPPRGLELGLQRLSFPGCPTEPEGEGAGVGVGGGQRESNSRGTIVTPLKYGETEHRGMQPGPRGRTAVEQGLNPGAPILPPSLVKLGSPISHPYPPRVWDCLSTTLLPAATRGRG